MKTTIQKSKNRYLSILKTTLAALVIVILFSFQKAGTSVATISLKVKAPFDMPVLKIPDFRHCNRYTITDFGAVKNNKAKNAQAINAAIEEATKAGGGVVVIPEGEWITGKLHFKSNVNLHLNKGAVLLFDDNPNDYLPAVSTSWEGMECYNYSPLIYAYNCENIAITGEGTIKAKMDLWKTWSGRPRPHMESLKRLYNMSYQNTPVSERLMVNDSAHLRPHFIQFNRCKNIRIEGISIVNSPFWTIHMYLSKDILLRNLNVYAHGHNNDGFDPEMSQNILVENCVFDQGDDAIAVKSGRNQEGWRSETPSKNIVIRNCNIKNGHQLLALGSELSGGIENIYIHDCKVDKGARMFHVVFIKTNERMGGYVQNIHVRNIEAGKMDFGILGIETDVLYQWRDLVPTYIRKLTPIKNVYLENVKSANVKFIANISGQKELPVQNIWLQNVQADTVRGDKKYISGNVINFNVNRKQIQTQANADCLLQQPTPLKTVTEPEQGAFPLISARTSLSILIDDQDAEVVRIASEAVAKDLKLVGNKQPAVVTKTNEAGDYVIIAGTIGQSAYIDKLIKKQRPDIAKVTGKWESYIITTVEKPEKGIKQALVIAGSDRRGTAYGLFELSRMAGVSPWVWWADVTPASRKELYILPGTMISREPSVKYRGIFLNDEDWGLQPWAAKNMDKEIKDIGPETYRHVFELLLRLRANFIWPAMHDCTKAFYYYPENPVVADKYAIVVGSSHCEPMLRNNVFEWKENFSREYNEKPNDWRYDTNKRQISRYWDDRVKASKNFESVYTIGMRGIHDSGIPGPKTKTGKLNLMDTVIRDQRNIFKNYFGNAEKVPQLFCPYKEVLDIYHAGLTLPEDVTLVWPDDNHGYLRQLSTPDEQKRSGGSGVYYHISYWGAPHDYLWLSSTSPALISYEMTKAYQFGANRLWVVNVGDIKPGEAETQFFLDLAWDINSWTPEKAQQYTSFWAEQTFGRDIAPRIAAIKNQYYALAQNAKPEHLRMLRFDNQSKSNRLAAYAQLVKEVDKVKQQLPEKLHSAYFQLIEYPVKGAALLNEKIYSAGISIELSQKGDRSALQYSRKAEDAYERIKNLTEYYNTAEQGKWNGIMNFAPRKLPVFDKPIIASETMLADSQKIPALEKQRYTDSIPAVPYPLQSGSIYADKYTAMHDNENDRILTINGLAASGKSISRYPFTGKSYDNEQYVHAPYVEYSVQVPAGGFTVALNCLPTQAIHKGRLLRMAITVDETQIRFVDFNNPKEDRNWQINVLTGNSETKVKFENTTPGTKKIRLYLLDTGLALSHISVTGNN